MTFNRLALLLLFAALYLLGLSHPAVVDYDEAVYATVAKGMLESGDWIDPSYDGAPFHEKPPLLYWIECVGFLAFGVGPAGARAGTAIAALALLVLVFAFARGPLGERAALGSSVALGASLLFFMLARVAIVDGLLTLWLALCLFLLHRALEAEIGGRSGRALFLAACAAAGLATLTKGLIGIVLPVAAALAHAGSIGRLRLLLRPAWLLPGTVVMLGVGFSWYLLLGLTRPDGFAFVRELFVEHHFQRFAQAKEGHSGSPAYFVPVLLLGLLPWSLFLLPAVDRGVLRDVSTSGGRLLRLFGLFSAIAFLFFSVSATKLPNYVAPVLPGAALWIGALFGGERRARLFDLRRGRFAVGATAVLLALLGGALAAAAVIAGDPPRAVRDAAASLPPLQSGLRLGPGAWIGAALLVAAAVAVLRVARRRDPGALFAALAAPAIAWEMALAGLLLPEFERQVQRPLLDAAGLAARHVPEPERLVTFNLMRRASIPFHVGRGTEYWGGALKEPGARLEGSGLRHGVATRADFEEHLVPLGAVELDDVRGYVVFRIEWDEPAPAAAADAVPASAGRE